jgi:K+-sensing histidine kinase KdpD
VEKAVKDLGFDTSHNIGITGDQQLEVIADYDRIGQVVINLLNNAVKYAPQQKGINVHIEQIHNEAKVSVWDFGMGIISEELPYVFERYHRGERLNPNISGLGLGLYTSNKILKSHHGQMGVEVNTKRAALLVYTSVLTKAFWEIRLKNRTVTLSLVLPVSFT